MARANTVNGSIRGEMGRADWSGRAGDEHRQRQHHADAAAGRSAPTCKASTVNGDINTDFPVTVTGRVVAARSKGRSAAAAARSRSRGQRQYHAEAGVVHDGTRAM